MRFYQKTFVSKKWKKNSAQAFCMEKMFAGSKMKKVQTNRWNRLSKCVFDKTVIDLRYSSVTYLKVATSKANIFSIWNLGSVL